MLDVNKKLQNIDHPTIDDCFVGKRIEMKFKMKEVGKKGKNKLIWCKGKVVAVKNNENDVTIK